MKNKEKCKKNKKVIIFLILIILMVIIIFTVRAILAYLTDTDTKINKFIIGKVSIKILEDNWDALTDSNEDGVPDIATNIISNQTIPKDPQIENTGINDAFVYLKVKVPKDFISKDDTSTTELFTYNVNNGWSILNDRTKETEDYIERVYYYSGNNSKLESAKKTPTLFDEVKFADIKSGTVDLKTSPELIEIFAYAIQSSGVPDEYSTAPKAFDLYFKQEKSEDEKLVNLFYEINEQNYSEYYGQYVDLNTNLLGNTSNHKVDWKIFYKDTEGIWLILSDYLPNNTGIAQNIGLNNSGIENEEDYSVFGVNQEYGTRSEFINKLLSSNWTNEILSQDLIQKGARAKGALDLPTFVNCWNDLYGKTNQIYITNTLNSNGGYNLSISEQIESDDYFVNMKDSIGYSDSLFYPNTNSEGKDGCFAYWLATPSTENEQSVMRVTCGGAIRGSKYTAKENGIRPVVFLPSDVSYKYQNGVYKIVY